MLEKNLNKFDATEIKMTEQKNLPLLMTLANIIRELFEDSFSILSSCLPIRR